MSDQSLISLDTPDSPVPCLFVTGSAGSGKTYKYRQLVADNPAAGVLCATTGIAAINLGTQTLNSLLRYFDTDSLRDLFTSGKLASRLHQIGRKAKSLIIDEVSMMDSRQLDYLHDAVRQANNYKDMQDAPLGLTLIGDFCQLPPIEGKFVFEADCWPGFESNTEKLTKMWRQDSGEFLQALAHARGGRGSQAVAALQSIGVKFRPQVDGQFPGTTIISKNQQVDNFNLAALLNVPGTAFGLKRALWGQNAGEWNNIPDLLKLKDNAYVMILSNSTEGEYANGDCGHIMQRDENGMIWVKLKRNENLVGIAPIVRNSTLSMKDGEEKGLDAFQMPHQLCTCGWDNPGRLTAPWDQPSFNCALGRFNVGGVKFYPLRLAYASTVHKSQGLTLDNIQIDCRDSFFGSPAMAYVAMSRARTPEGLTIVGTPGRLAEAIKVNPKVSRYI